jgi:hypothetical protein
MSSVYFGHTKVGAGELFFALCGQDGVSYTSGVETADFLSQQPKILQKRLATVLLLASLLQMGC